MTKPPPPPREDNASIGAAVKYAGFGFQLAGSILLFLYLGRWVDRRVGTEPLFLLLGVFIGLAASIYSLYRSLMADQRREDDQKQQGGAP